jgi:deoxyribodipyrimidine photolyase
MSINQDQLESRVVNLMKTMESFNRLDDYIVDWISVCCKVDAKALASKWGIVYFVKKEGAVTANINQIEAKEREIRKEP